MPTVTSAWQESTAAQTLRRLTLTLITRLAPTTMYSVAQSQLQTNRRRVMSGPIPPPLSLEREDVVARTQVT